MKVSNLLILAIITLSHDGGCYAFLGGAHIPSAATATRTQQIHNPSFQFTTTTALQMSDFMATPAPDDEAVRNAYAQWRQKHNKGEFDTQRYQNFKSNFLAVTAKNNMELQRARQSGQQPPAPTQLNEYGDCSAEEYRAIMQRGGIRDPNTRIAPSYSSSGGLRPTNDFSNPSRGGTRQQQMSAAQNNLRAAMDQRGKLEGELMQLKQRLEEKQRLLAQAEQEEQYCKNRIALREEQKRLLNDRLQNGWEDERGLM
jgi:hypothetical protein